MSGLFLLLFLVHLSFFMSGLFLLLFLVQCAKKGDIVGKVGDEVVTREEYEKVLKNQFQKNDLSEISLEDKKKTLNELLEFRLKIIKAKQLGYEKEENVLRTYFEIRGYDIKGVAVLIGFNNAQYVKAKRSKEEAEKLASEVVQQLKDGADAEEIAVKYSDDPTAKTRKGVLDPYRAGMFDIAVDKALMNAGENSVVGPVVTDKAIFIVKVNEKRKKAGYADFDQEKERLKKELFQRNYRNEGNKTVKAWKKGPNPQDNQFSEDQRAVKLARIDGEEFSVGQFIDQFRGRFHKFYQRYQDTTQVKKALENQINYYAWIITARKKGLEKNPDIVKEIKRLTEHKLAELLEKHQVREKVSFTEDELQAYYQANKEKYIDPRKIQIWEIAVKDEALAKRITRMAKRNKAKFEDLAKKYTEKKGRKSRGGYLGYQTDRSALGEMMKKAFDAGPNKIIGPMQYGIFYYILKTGDFKPRRQKSLKEVRTLVEAAVKRDHGNKIRKAMMDELHQKYPFWINEKLLEKMS
ncbi:hypothetical protein B1H10_08225 [candidate division KSB1 bacterium 4484_188]|nr:MAG: hypothetical protein B1H10_08225 [candidate division KSB1 bacterium 4484_188]